MLIDLGWNNMRFTESELKKIAQGFKDMNISKYQICKSYITALGLKLGKKDLTLGNKVGACSAFTMCALMDDLLE